MIQRLKPYPAMKDSGVPWLGEVPEHWSQLPARACYHEKKVLNSGLQETTVLSLSYGQVVVKPIEKLHGLVPASFETYQIVGSGDIIIRPTDLQNDWNSLRFGLNRHRGIITSAYMCFRTKGTLIPEYGHLLLHTYDLKKVFYGLGSGLRQNLDWEDFKYLPCIVPPVTEQLAIVRFLKHTDRRIRGYIVLKQKLINLLEEQKYAIIQGIITRGIDTSARLKPSGVEWLGLVPENWALTRLKFLATDIVDCLHATPAYSDSGDHPAIRTADVIPGNLLLEQARRVDEEHYHKWTARMAPAGGDILYTREGERFGIAALVPPDVRLCISQRMMAFRINEKHNSAYVMWQINCQHVYAQAAADLMGAAAPHVNVERIRNLQLAVPPRREQDAIVTAVEVASEGPRGVIQRTRDEIRLLREYRTRLIADVVTGKLDVREAAAKLPDEPEETELLLAASEVDVEPDVDLLDDEAALNE